MTPAQRIEWIGEFALTLLGFGFLYAIARAFEGPDHHAAIALPLAWRLVLVLALAIVATTARVRLAARRKRRRQQSGHR